MAQNIEDFLPPIQSAGLNTLKNTSLGGTLAVTGTSTFTGAVSFLTSPTFTGGRLTNVVNETTSGTLTISQSGSTLVYNSTTGIVLKLPAPTAGIQYRFIVAQGAQTGTHGILTSASTFLLGGVGMNSNGTVAAFTANGTSNTNVGMNGTTTGGTQGTVFEVVGQSSTVWLLSGQLLGSGALATPIV